MRKVLCILPLLAILMLSIMLVTIPMSRCEDEEDPVHICYAGNTISESPGPIVWTGPCNTESFTFTVRVQWDTLHDPGKVSWVTVTMTEKSSYGITYGITFSPQSFTLYNPSPYYQDVLVTVPVKGLAAGTYAAHIYVSVTGQGPNDTPKVAGTDGYFQFVKQPCVTTAKVTFDVVGVGSDFTGTVLTVDGTPYTVSQLPQIFTWDIGSEHTFAYDSPLTIDSCKRYVWDSTLGLSSAQTGTITVPSGGGSVTAYYHTEYYLTVKSDPEGLATISGEGWYEEGTGVELTAPDVTGYIFVFWDVDGTAVEGNPITVTMDTCHTATAHYWPELGYEQFVTDSNFNKITEFDIVWTPKDAKKTTFKLASTNPGQFMLNIVVSNTWPVATGPITITFTIDPDFILKGADPIQVYDGYGKTGNRIPATVTFDPATGTGTVTIENINPGTTYYITVHMEYGKVGEYFTKDDMENWKATHKSNTFYCGYTVTVPGPFPFDITSTTSTTITIYDS
jgi:hypothetical protein